MKRLKTDKGKGNIYRGVEIPIVTISFKSKRRFRKETLRKAEDKFIYDSLSILYDSFSWYWWISSYNFIHREGEVVKSLDIDDGSFGSLPSKFAFLEKKNKLKELIRKIERSNGAGNEVIIFDRTDWIIEKFEGLYYFYKRMGVRAVSTKYIGVEPNG